MKKRTETFTKNCDAISEIIGELMMITIAVVAFGLLVVIVFSYKGPADSPQADIDSWVNAGTDTVYFRHGGGELIDAEDLMIMLNLNGTSVELSPADLALIYGKPGWGLGDTIEINTSDEWGITIGEDDYVGATIVHTGAGVVIQTGTLLGEAVVPTATATATATPTPTPPPTAPPVSLWKFDEDAGEIAYDSVDGNDGAIHGATWTTGINGSALSFDGTDDYVIKNPFSNFPQEEITAEFWMKSSDTSKRGTPISYASSSSQNDFLIYDYRSFSIYRGGAYVGTGISANDGNWHHIAVTWNSSDGSTKLYKDGVLAYSGTLATGSSITPGGSFVVGQEQDSVGGGFDGSQAFLGTIDEVAIHNRVLTAEEILEQYNALKPTMVSEWRFDAGVGTIAYDSAGNNDGKIYGTIWNGGISGSALDFNGKNDYVEVSDDNSLDITNSLTISVWIVSRDTSTYKSIITKGNPYKTGDGKLNYGLQSLPNSNLRFFVFTGGKYYHVDSTGKISTDDWANIVVTFDSGIVNFYIDGVSVGSEKFDSSTLPTSNHPLYIGKHIHSSVGSSQFWDGKIDEVKIYNSVLNTSEVFELYNSSIAGRFTQYHLDENSGSTAYDSINSNDAKISGASWKNGICGKALSFDGKNDYASASLGSLNAPFTVETWGYFDNINQPKGDYDYILMVGTGANTISISRNAEDNRFYSWCENEQKLGPVLQGKQWLHIVSVYNTSPPYHTLYINGESQKVDQPSATIKTNGNLNLGRYEPSNTHWMGGMIDEFVIYKKTLSAEEIKTRYNALKS